MSAADALFLLAFDHRQSLVRGLFDSDERRADALAPALKLLVLEGLRHAIGDGLPDGVTADRVGVLVDDRYGAEAARAARDAGLTVAVAVERSGQRELALEHGDAWAAALAALEPRFAKVLVRYNPDDPDPRVNTRQRALLRVVSQWCAEHEPQLLLELLVPPTPAQLAACDGLTERYDALLRPALVARAMAELQAGAVAPSLWKIEGLEDAAAAQAVAAQALHGLQPAPCLVLGRGADDAKVDHWLAVAAPVHGFAGFAIGRSIWWTPARRWLDGQLDRPAAAAAIAAAYRRAVVSYLEAAAGVA